MTDDAMQLEDLTLAGDDHVVPFQVEGLDVRGRAVQIGPMLDAITRALPLLAEGQDDAFQTKVTHLAPAPGGETE